MLKLKLQYFWPTDEKSQLPGKDPDAGKDWRQEEKGATENTMVWRHHQLIGHEFEQAPGIGDAQENLECSHPWGQKKSDTTEQLNWIIQYLIVQLEIYSYFFFELFLFASF